MRLLKLLSKTMHFAMLFCFCLPFLKGCDGCGTPSEDIAAIETEQKHIADSLFAWEATITAENINAIAHIPDTCGQYSEPEEEYDFDAFYRQVLQPNGDFSGYGLIALGIGLGVIPIYLPLALFILLVLISLICSFWKKNSFKWIFIFSSIETSCLLLFFSICYEDILYGFWLTACACLINLFCTYLIWSKNKSPSP